MYTYSLLCIFSMCLAQVLTEFLFVFFCVTKCLLGHILSSFYKKKLKTVLKKNYGFLIIIMESYVIFW